MGATTELGAHMGRRKLRTVVQCHHLRDACCWDCHQDARAWAAYTERLGLVAILKRWERRSRVVFHILEELGEIQPSAETHEVSAGLADSVAD
jgi:hypothetical protein